MSSIKLIPKWLLLVLFIVGLTLIIISTTLRLHSVAVLPDAVDYGITIDASSSKTKITLYDWMSEKENGTGHVTEKASEKLNLRIDKHVDNLTDLIPQLTTTLDKVSWNINETRQSFQVPIYLGATAGMRLLDADNSNHSDKIFAEIKSNFRNYAAERKRFKMEDAEIISGEKEGLYAWVAANYLMDFVPPRNRRINSTVGILEMGGASAQIAFQTLCKTKDGCMREEEATNLIANEQVELFDIIYDVYTYSNLCYGNDGARRRYQIAAILDQSERTGGVGNQIDDPCTHLGQSDRQIYTNQILGDVCTNSDRVRTKLQYDSYVFIARPNFMRCQELTKRLVSAHYVEKYFGGRNIEFKAMEESPPSDMPFYALATYYYTMSQVGIKFGLHFDDEIDMMQAIQGYCNRTWQDVTSEQNDFDKQIEFLHNYCFSMNFIFMTLKHVYKFEGSQFGKIEFRQKLDRGELSWTLGYMLQATNSIVTEEPTLGMTTFITLLTIGIVIAFLTAILFCISKSMPEQTELDLKSMGKIESGLSDP